MLKEGLLDSLYAKRQSPAEFNFEALMAPSMYNFLSEYDFGKIYDITTSIKYSSKVDMKIQAIKDILAPRGFVQLANGTNRMCFRYLEDKSIVLKVAYKKSGLDNGIREFANQQLLKPFVAKTFEVHPSGIASMHERVLPITNREELLSVADDVFDLLTMLNGKYVLDDVGSEYFMNLGIRSGFGVVIIDYVDLYEVDGKKLYCNRPVIPNTKWPLCGGLIDLDDGFNRFVCTKCGKTYSASDLAKARENRDIILEGDINMRVTLLRNGEVVAVSDDVTDTIVKPTVKNTKKRPSELKVSLIRHVDQPIVDTTIPVVEKEPVKEIEVESVKLGSFEEESKDQQHTESVVAPSTKQNPAKINIKIGKKDKPSESTNAQKKLATAAANTTNRMVEAKEAAQVNLINETAVKYGLTTNDLEMMDSILMSKGHNHTLMDLNEDQLNNLFSTMKAKKESANKRIEELKDAIKTSTPQKQENKDDSVKARLNSKFIPTATDIDNY